MRLFIIALAAIGSPAAAFPSPEARAYAAADSFRVGRGYVYFDQDVRWNPRIFSRDDGYFQGRGAGVSIAGGRAMFDYDRDYPYDFPAGWSAAEPDMDDGWDANAREPECTDEPVRDRRSGRSAVVRVCR